MKTKTVFLSLRSALGGAQGNFKSIPWAIAIVLCWGIGFAPSISVAQQIHWYSDLNQATIEAQANNKLVLMHFTADWCKPCRNLETFVYTSAQVQRAFDQNVVAVKIDVDENPHLVNEYGVGSVPFDVAITPAGRVISKRKCPKDSSSYAKMINSFHTLIRGVSSGESPVLAELNEAINAQTPSFDARSTSFTPDSPTHRAPEPSARSAELKRNSRFVANPFVQPPQQANAAASSPQHVVNAFAPTSGPDGTSNFQSQDTAASHQESSPTKMSTHSPKRPGAAFITNPTIAQTTPQSTSNADPSIPQRQSSTFVAPGKNLKSGAPSRTGALVINQFQSANDAPTASTGFVPPIKTDDHLTAPANHFQPNAQPAAGQNQLVTQTKPGNLEPTPFKLPAAEKTTMPGIESKEPALSLQDNQVSSADHPASNPLAPTKSASPSDFLPPEPPSFVDTPEPKKGHSATGFLAQNVTEPSAISRESNPSPNADATLDLSAAPAESPEYALHGKCPVTLLSESKWVDGDRRWGCVHRNRIYLFANEAHLKTFQSDPDAHSPILAGFDPVIYEETGKLVDGLELHGVFMGRSPQQRIVLFANAQTRAKFQATPKKYLEAVRQAMKKTGASSKLMR